MASSSCSPLPFTYCKKLGMSVTILFMKYLLILAFFCLSSGAQVSGIKDLIRDPALSFRCKALLTERNEKVQVKQRLDALYKRTKSLWRKTPKHKKTLRDKLKLTGRQVRNHLRLSQMRIRHMEEDIIRKGCPGITL